MSREFERNSDGSLKHASDREYCRRESDQLQVKRWRDAYREGGRDVSYTKCEKELKEFKKKNGI